jgi:hypothetical protein
MEDSGFICCNNPSPSRVHLGISEIMDDALEEFLEVSQFNVKPMERPFLLSCWHVLKPRERPFHPG